MKKAIKKILIISISILMAILLILGIAIMDTENLLIPFSMCGIALLWLVPCGIANGYFYKE